MPSMSTERWKEQYGRVAAEAMACGRLVIASDSGSLPELVGEAGIIIPQTELPRLDRELARVLDDPSLVQRIGAKAAERARAELAIPVQAVRMHEQFIKWARPSRAPSAAAAAIG
jgi:glycosyltransferase involved in cell wall biosynthesis